MAKLPSYVLITPARNEAQFIELTLKSVVEQTVRPLKWVIVSDGSTDGTDDIVSKYVADHPWIELVRRPVRSERHFAGKVDAFNAGYGRTTDVEYDIIGNLDADISFDEDQFAMLMSKFAENPRLGVAGTPYRQGTVTYNYGFASIEDVNGHCQMFRRQCFEDIGGYVPVKGGGIDHIAVVTARMKGWHTRTFTDKVALHHRRTGTAETGVLGARFRDGAKDYAMGNDPIWELFRTGYQMTQPPLGIGGVVLGFGYLWCLVRRVKRPVSPQLMAFKRREQILRLKRYLTGTRPPLEQRLAKPS